MHASVHTNIHMYIHPHMDSSDGQIPKSHGGNFTSLGYNQSMPLLSVLSGMH